MASSTHNQRHHHLPPNVYSSTTSAPPPTPSSQLNTHHHLTSSSATIDALTHLLHRLPPNLSLPTRRGSSSLSTTSPPLISLSDQTSADHLLSACSQHGFFQLHKHNIPSHLANSAEVESLSLFKLAKDKKESYFPKNWPLGFNDDDEEGNGESFWLDGDCSASTELPTELSLSSLRELTRGLEKLGLEAMEMLSKAVGFENPFKAYPTRLSSMMSVHEGSYGDKPDHISGGFYPYVVGLQYEIRSRKYWLLADSGWVAVVPQVDSVLVTVGDIAQVWSNGKLKRVRGRPLPCMGDGKDSSCITMTLLLTLPTETTISPLLPELDTHNSADDEVREEEEEEEEEDEKDGKNVVKKEKRMFNSFSFEDYAWRVYHEPFIFKDPLDKYRICR
eukprot:XP_002528301.2 gibberellin 2-beta-dioxygenase 2 [Ricinus communis]